ncbi:hypothetical protein Tco_1337261 [Tanacetum coccineum]
MRCGGCQTHPCGWAVKPNAPLGGDGGMEEKDGDEEEMVVGATVVWRGAKRWWFLVAAMVMVMMLMAVVDLRCGEGSGDGGVMMVRRLVVASRRERWRRGDEGGVEMMVWPRWRRVA